MSESEGSDAPAMGPSDSVLTEALRNSVKKVFESERLEDLTVKRIRKATEEQLELAEEFFKHDSKWSARSKHVIEEEAEAQHALRDEIEILTPSPIAKKPISRQKQLLNEKTPPEPSKPKAKTLPTTRGTKRSLPLQESNGRKRQKKDESSNSELSELSESSAGVKPRKVSQKRAGPKDNNQKRSIVKTVLESEEEAEKPNGFGQADVTQILDSAELKKNEKDGEIDAEDAASDSEMSVLIDEDASPKRKGRKPSARSVAKKPAKAKSRGPSKSKDDANLDPQQAEIKRLQSWLLKCGIRKMWHKELAPHDTPKAKINHLKGMLKDAGMDGRYSAEKAKQIKEHREFKADLEAVQEGAKKWGQSGGSEASDTEERKPKRRLARGLKALDFLSDSSGEESD
ncbi:MAG: hypothetical protein M1835_002878 [Candelina submexicana]|nr:MAG: hypothetical protein M1835_002878 [Candelina submexicana]